MSTVNCKTKCKKLNANIKVQNAKLWKSSAKGGFRYFDFLIFDI